MRVNPKLEKGENIPCAFTPQKTLDQLLKSAEVCISWVWLNVSH